MASVKAIIRKSRVNNKGEVVVYIRYGHQQKSVDISTGIKVLLQHWVELKESVNSLTGINKNQMNQEMIDHL